MGGGQTTGTARLEDQLQAGISDPSYVPLPPHFSHSPASAQFGHCKRFRQQSKLGCCWKHMQAAAAAAAAKEPNPPPCGACGLSHLGF